MTYKDTILENPPLCKDVKLKKNTEETQCTFSDKTLSTQKTLDNLYSNSLWKLKQGSKLSVNQTLSHTHFLIILHKKMFSFYSFYKL